MNTFVTSRPQELIEISTYVKIRIEEEGIRKADRLCLAGTRTEAALASRTHFYSLENMGQRPEKDARTPVFPNSANVGPNLESRNLIPLTRARTSCDLIAKNDCKG